MRRPSKSDDKDDSPSVRAAAAAASPAPRRRVSTVAALASTPFRLNEVADARVGVVDLAELLHSIPSSSSPFHLPNTATESPSQEPPRHVAAKRKRSLTPPLRRVVIDVDDPSADEAPPLSLPLAATERDIIDTCSKDGRAFINHLSSLLKRSDVISSPRVIGRVVRHRLKQLLSACDGLHRLPSWPADVELGLDATVEATSLSLLLLVSEYAAPLRHILRHIEILACLVESLDSVMRDTAWQPSWTLECYDRYHRRLSAVCTTVCVLLQHAWGDGSLATDTHRQIVARCVIEDGMTHRWLLDSARCVAIIHQLLQLDGTLTRAVATRWPHLHDDLATLFTNAVEHVKEGSSSTSLLGVSLLLKAMTEFWPWCRATLCLSMVSSLDVIVTALMRDMTSSSPSENEALQTVTQAAVTWWLTLSHVRLDLDAAVIVQALLRAGLTLSTQPSPHDVTRKIVAALMLCLRRFLVARPTLQRTLHHVMATALSHGEPSNDAVTLAKKQLYLLMCVSSSGETGVVGMLAALGCVIHRHIHRSTWSQWSHRVSPSPVSVTQLRDGGRGVVLLVYHLLRDVFSYSSNVAAGVEDFCDALLWGDDDAVGPEDAAEAACLVGAARGVGTIDVITVALVVATARVMETNNEITMALKPLLDAIRNVHEAVATWLLPSCDTARVTLPMMLDAAGSDSVPMRDIWVFVVDRAMFRVTSVTPPSSFAIAAVLGVAGSNVAAEAAAVKLLTHCLPVSVTTVARLVYLASPPLLTPRHPPPPACIDATFCLGLVDFIVYRSATLFQELPEYFLHVPAARPNDDHAPELAMVDRLFALTHVSSPPRGTVSALDDGTLSPPLAVASQFWQAVRCVFYLAVQDCSVRVLVEEFPVVWVFVMMAMTDCWSAASDQATLWEAVETRVSQEGEGATIDMPGLDTLVAVAREERRHVLHFERWLRGDNTISSTTSSALSNRYSRDDYLMTCRPRGAVVPRIPMALVAAIRDLNALRDAMCALLLASTTPDLLDTCIATLCDRSHRRVTSLCHGADSIRRYVFGAAVSPTAQFIRRWVPPLGRWVSVLGMCDTLHRLSIVSRCEVVVATMLADDDTIADDSLVMAVRAHLEHLVVVAVQTVEGGGGDDEDGSIIAGVTVTHFFLDLMSSLSNAERGVAAQFLSNVAIMGAASTNARSQDWLSFIFPLVSHASRCRVGTTTMCAWERHVLATAVMAPLCVCSDTASFRVSLTQALHLLHLSRAAQRLLDLSQDDEDHVLALPHSEWLHILCVLVSAVVLQRRLFANVALQDRQVWTAMAQVLHARMATPLVAMPAVGCVAIPQRIDAELCYSALVVVSVTGDGDLGVAGDVIATLGTWMATDDLSPVVAREPLDHLVHVLDRLVATGDATVRAAKLRLAALLVRQLSLQQQLSLVSCALLADEAIDVVCAWLASTHTTLARATVENAGLVVGAVQLGLQRRAAHSPAAAALLDGLLVSPVSADVTVDDAVHTDDSVITAVDIAMTVEGGCVDENDIEPLRLLQLLDEGRPPTDVSSLDVFSALLHVLLSLRVRGATAAVVGVGPDTLPLVLRVLRLRSCDSHENAVLRRVVATVIGRDVLDADVVVTRQPSSMPSPCAVPLFSEFVIVDHIRGAVNSAQAVRSLVSFLHQRHWESKWYLGLYLDWLVCLRADDYVGAMFSPDVLSQVAMLEVWPTVMSCVTFFGSSTDAWSTVTGLLHAAKGMYRGDRLRLSANPSSLPMTSQHDLLTMSQRSSAISYLLDLVAWSDSLSMAVLRTPILSLEITTVEGLGLHVASKNTTDIFADQKLSHMIVRAIVHEAVLVKVGRGGQADNVPVLSDTVVLCPSEFEVSRLRLLVGISSSSLAATSRFVQYLSLLACGRRRTFTSAQYDVATRDTAAALLLNLYCCLPGKTSATISARQLTRRRCCLDDTAEWCDALSAAPVVTTGIDPMLHRLGFRLINGLDPLLPLAEREGHMPAMQLVFTELRATARRHPFIVMRFAPSLLSLLTAYGHLDLSHFVQNSGLFVFGETLHILQLLRSHLLPPPCPHSVAADADNAQGMGVVAFSILAPYFDLFRRLGRPIARQFFRDLSRDAEKRLDDIAAQLAKLFCHMLVRRPAVVIGHVDCMSAIATLTAKFNKSHWSRQLSDLVDGAGAVDDNLQDLPLQPESLRQMVTKLRGTEATLDKKLQDVKRATQTIPSVPSLLVADLCVLLENRNGMTETRATDLYDLLTSALKRDEDFELHSLLRERAEEVARRCDDHSAVGEPMTYEQISDRIFHCHMGYLSDIRQYCQRERFALAGSEAFVRRSGSLMMSLTCCDPRLPKDEVDAMVIAVRRSVDLYPMLAMLQKAELLRQLFTLAVGQRVSSSNVTSTTAATIAAEAVATLRTILQCFGPA